MGENINNIFAFMIEIKWEVNSSCFIITRLIYSSIDEEGLFLIFLIFYSLPLPRYFMPKDTLNRISNTSSNNLIIRTISDYWHFLMNSSTLYYYLIFSGTDSWSTSCPSLSNNFQNENKKTIKIFIFNNLIGVKTQLFLCKSSFIG